MVSHVLPTRFRKSLRVEGLTQRKLESSASQRDPLWKKLQTLQRSPSKERKSSHATVVGPPRRGVKITYAVDTRPVEAVAELAKGSDLLIHDSCFDESVAVKAKSYGHSTATEAASVAKKKQSAQTRAIPYQCNVRRSDASPKTGEKSISGNRLSAKIWKRFISHSDLAGGCSGWYRSQVVYRLGQRQLFRPDRYRAQMVILLQVHRKRRGQRKLLACSGRIVYGFQWFRSEEWSGRHFEFFPA